MPESQVARVPDTLDDAQAADVPEVFVAAHDALFTLARLGSGETLLVDAVNGVAGSVSAIGRF